MNYYLKVIKSGKVIDKCRTHSIRRFLKNLRTIKWQDGGIKAYLRVGYGKGKDVFNKTVNFYNDGWYENKKDLWSSFEVFREED